MSRLRNSNFLECWTGWRQVESILDDRGYGTSKTPTLATDKVTRRTFETSCGDEWLGDDWFCRPCRDNPWWSPRFPAPPARHHSNHSEENKWMTTRRNSMKSFKMQRSCHFPLYWWWDFSFWSLIQANFSMLHQQCVDLKVAAFRNTLVVGDSNPPKVMTLEADKNHVSSLWKI